MSRPCLGMNTGMGHWSRPQCHSMDGCGGQPKLAKETGGTGVEGRIGWGLRALLSGSTEADIIVENSASSHGNFTEVVAVIAAVATPQVTTYFPLSYFALS